MARAVIGDELGALDNYSLRPFDPGPPGPGEVQIAIRAAGVSFVDVLNATGRYQARAPVPFIPGSECSGVVQALGRDVRDLAVGQPVIATTWGGVFAELANLPAAVVDPMPAGMAFEEAAVFKVSATTAWHALVDRARLQAGETVLVLGAGGATGYAAVQIGRYLGARVIASASDEEKRALARRGGADAVLETGATTWREQVVEANHGRPLDVVFDPVGGEATEPAFRCLGWNGRHLVVGFPGGMTSLPTNLPLLKSASLVGVNLQQFARAEPEQAAANVAQLVQLGGQGLFVPVVAQKYPLEDFARAMAAAAEGRTAGRIVLIMA